MRKLFYIVCFLPFNYHSQKAIVSDEIHSPLTIPLNLSTLFGDICPNHLHMGLDFRTNGVEGVPVFSIREGYVSRIRISRGGYGKVLYVNHPNGHTSVYAHCSKFFENIDSLVSKWQVERQENEIDTNLSAFILPVIKGQQIAFSGNSGSSTGPHLHFEIRETLNEIALNPLEHGFQLIDETPPVIEAIKIVPVSREGFVIENTGIAVPPFLESSKSAENTPIITLPTNQFSNSSSIGIMVKGGDRMKINGNKFDFYKSEVYFNSTLVFKCVMDSVSFDHTRYVNDYCDYKAYK
ncbi:MAG: M23 family metallopeptidase, partial [Crocinitomicaceae bacterium]